MECSIPFLGIFIIAHFLSFKYLYLIFVHNLEEKKWTK